MPITLDIVPLSDSVDMLYDDQDQSSVFSLSGHVSVSITSPTSMFQRRYASLVLESLTIAFEGQSEVVGPDLGYAPLRLCDISRELVRGRPVQLSNEGYEESEKPCVWNVIFDIQVPGWLPATSQFGESIEESGTRYALYATAKFSNVDEGGSAKSFILSTLCSPFSSNKSRVVHAPRCPITLNRYMDPPPIPSSSARLFPERMFSVTPNRRQDDKDGSTSAFPFEVLKEMEIMVSVPSGVDTTDSSLPFALRLRAKNLADEHRKRVRVTEFTVDLEQMETYRNAPPLDHHIRYDIPPSSRQPPHQPLRVAHSARLLYDVGLLGSSLPPQSAVHRTFSLLPLDESGIYQVAGDGYIFRRDSNDADFSASWYILNATVPVDANAPRVCGSYTGGPCSLRPSELSPLFSVRHKMSVSLKIEYDLPGDKGVATELLQFGIPFSFWRISPAPSPITSDARSGNNDISMTPTEPYAPSLPAYSQLFHANGDRKEAYEYSIPLPLYEPPSIVPSHHTLAPDEQKLLSSDP